MDDDFVQKFLEAFARKGEGDMGDGDYKDFLINYMNAKNHGAQQEQLEDMANLIPGNRRDAMANDQAVGDLNLEKNPFINAARAGANGLLRRDKQ